MDIRNQIRAKILSNKFTFKDYSAFKTNMKIVKKRYHPDLTADVDLLESITQMAEDSTSVKGLLFTNFIMLLVLLKEEHLTAAFVFFAFALATVISFCMVWIRAKERNLPVSTEFRLIKLAIRMRKMLKIRAHQQKAKIKAEKKQRRSK